MSTSVSIKNAHDRMVAARVQAMQDDPLHWTIEGVQCFAVLPNLCGAVRYPY